MCVHFCLSKEQLWSMASCLIQAVNQKWLFTLYKCTDKQLWLKKKKVFHSSSIKPEVSWSSVRTLTQISYCVLIRCFLSISYCLIHQGEWRLFYRCMALVKSLKSWFTSHNIMFCGFLSRWSDTDKTVLLDRLHREGGKCARAHPNVAIWSQW